VPVHQFLLHLVKVQLEAVLETLPLPWGELVNLGHRYYPTSLAVPKNPSILFGYKFRNRKTYMTQFRDVDEARQVLQIGAFIIEFSEIIVL
jgi:hypothetical protein